MRYCTCFFLFQFLRFRFFVGVCCWPLAVIAWVERPPLRFVLEGGPGHDGAAVKGVPSLSVWGSVVSAFSRRPLDPRRFVERRSRRVVEGVPALVVAAAVRAAYAKRRVTNVTASLVPWIHVHSKCLCPEDLGRLGLQRRTEGGILALDSIYQHDANRNPPGVSHGL